MEADYSLISALADGTIGKGVIGASLLMVVTVLVMPSAVPAVSATFDYRHLPRQDLTCIDGIIHLVLD